MKQLIKKLFPLLIILVPCFSSAQSVDLQFAEQIALQFYKQKSDSRKSAQVKVASTHTESKAGIGNLYHIVKFESEGFVVVSGNERFDPILAYSTENDLDFNEDFNPGVEYLRNMGRSMENQLAIDEPVIDRFKSKWDNFRNAKSVKTPDTIVAPLTTSKWGQDTYYNTDCPADQFGVDDKTFAGCITIALVQLLKYHGHPSRGNGTNFYDDYTYGTQSVDFGSTTYPWSSMPDELFNYDDKTAEAIYHAAVSINTEFSNVYTAAYFSTVRKALVYNYLFDRSAQFVKRATNPTGIEWYALIRSELDADRPTIMRADAFGSGAHSWLIDGYDDEDFYHMNWGWRGNGNGWYKDITVQWEWEEGGTNAFYADMDLIYNVFPADHCQDYEASADMYVATKTETTAKLSLFNYAGTITNQFRLRKVGDSDWIESDVSNELTRDYEDLLAGTEYEFQVKAMCSETVWNNYSDSFTFTTPGVACIGLKVEQVNAGGIGDSNATVTTAQPYGPNDNQWQYRVVNTSDWSETDIAQLHFTELTDLLSGTTYEYRVRHQCTPGIWSEYSEIATFTTEGDPPNTGNCDAPAFFIATSITDTYAYLIGSDFNSDQMNQFRYRISNADAWIETQVSQDSYRFIEGLTPGTEYEFSVREACADGTWSAYAATQTFATTGIAPAENDTACDAPYNLLTSSTTEHSTYIYLGFGSNEENQFRYREVGTGTWFETGVDELYYRFLPNLSAGSTYEFQARTRCENGQWSAFSNSVTFSTGGTTPSTEGACTVDADALDHDEWYFYYFITGFLQMEVQWRASSAGSWSSAFGTVNHYAALRSDLGIQQEGAQVRVRLQCADGSWTSYSSTYQLP